MKPVNVRRKTPLRAILLGCALAVASCQHEQVAGSSVTTGNPTEIQVSFTGDGGPMALTGRVEIFGATQIPVPGFKPEPLARYDVAAKQEFLLNPAHFEGIADSMWPAGSLEGDTLARFNLVITGAGRGAILRDLAFRIKEGEFALKDGAWTRGQGGAGLVKAGIKALIPYQATLDTTTLISRKTHYLFLLGTGFYSQESSGTFVFPALPEGVHQPVFIALPTKESQAQAPQDSVSYFGLDRPLGTDANPSATGEELGRIRIPQILK